MVRGSGPAETMTLTVLPLSTAAPSGTCWPATVKATTVLTGRGLAELLPRHDELEVERRQRGITCSTGIPTIGGSTDGVGPSET